MCASSSASVVMIQTVFKIQFPIFINLHRTPFVYLQNFYSDFSRHGTQPGKLRRGTRSSVDYHLNALNMVTLDGGLNFRHKKNSAVANSGL